MTISDALRAATERLIATSDTVRLDAELLMAHALGVSRSDLLLRHMNEPAPGGFLPMIERRLRHEPVAYIIGEAEFCGHSFIVNPAVLIPRGDSETLVEAALEQGPQTGRVLDLGTGSGALLLSVMAARPAMQGIGIDASFDAVQVAALNAQRLGLGDRARIFQRDWCEPGWADELGRFALILCNPPYVEDGAELASDVRDFEPASALFAGPEGLDDYRRIIPQLSDLLDERGLAVLEIGATQGRQVMAIAHESGFSTQLRRDLAGRDRAIILSR
ncbi:MAG: protein-(glutamine-N5) methyltransferase, release factor-specific [Erythrobacter sp. RIFCSPHIGHO2_12_FULL_63_10]|nr:MAG: protein-(glutamine-N5) methyltransferase, release factor-specific [Erythrobacter sp. RIFCSPHIGHO2_12_FULL_63_10]